MTLIAILLALLLERALSYSPRWRAHDLTGRWMQLIDARVPPGRWSLGLYLAPPLLLLALVLLWWAPQAGNLVSLVLATILLLACLGPRDLGEEINAYLRARRESRQQDADAMLSHLLTGPCRAEASPIGRSAVAAAFVQGHERWLAVLLWFFVLGGLGAVAYRMVSAIACHLRETGADTTLTLRAEWCHGLLAWPTARITVLLYALAGSTEHAFSSWRRWQQGYQGGWSQDPWPLLANVGCASLGSDPDEVADDDSRLAAALALVTRSLMILLAVLAVFTLGGWLN